MLCLLRCNFLTPESAPKSDIMLIQLDDDTCLDLAAAAHIPEGARYVSFKASQGTNKALAMTIKSVMELLKAHMLKMVDEKWKAGESIDLSAHDLLSCSSLQQKLTRLQGSAVIEAIDGDELALLDTILGDDFTPADTYELWLWEQNLVSFQAEYWNTAPGEISEICRSAHVPLSQLRSF